MRGVSDSIPKGSNTERSTRSQSSRPILISGGALTVKAIPNPIVETTQQFNSLTSRHNQAFEDENQVRIFDVKALGSTSGFSSLAHQSKSALTSRATSTRRKQENGPDTIQRRFASLYKQRNFQEALDLLSLTPQHHSYFNRGIE